MSHTELTLARLENLLLTACDDLREKGKKADLMFVQHMLTVLKSYGLLATVMLHGVLFRGGEEREARRHFIDSGYLKAGAAARKHVAARSLTAQAAITLQVQRTKNRQDTLKADITNLRAKKLGLMQDLLTGKVPVNANNEIVSGASG